MAFCDVRAMSVFENAQECAGGKMSTRDCLPVSEGNSPLPIDRLLLEQVGLTLKHLVGTVSGEHSRMRRNAQEAKCPPDIKII